LGTPFRLSKMAVALICTPKVGRKPTEGVHHFGEVQQRTTNQAIQQLQQAKPDNRAGFRGRQRKARHAIYTAPRAGAGEELNHAHFRGNEPQETGKMGVRTHLFLFQIPYSLNFWLNSRKRTSFQAISQMRFFDGLVRSSDAPGSIISQIDLDCCPISPRAGGCLRLRARRSF